MSSAASWYLRPWRFHFLHHMALSAILLMCPSHALAQSQDGELRVSVRDAAGLSAQSALHLASQSSQYRVDATTDAQGAYTFKRLAHGVYTLVADYPGFAPVSQLIQIQSALPQRVAITLEVAALKSSVTVSEDQTLLDPNQTTSVEKIGQDTIEHRQTSLPGRSIVDLVASEPGWLFEGNAVLHPRGSEYGTQFVVDGVPLTDNRSPGMGVEIEGDDVQSMSIYTAGFPAEYGRKLGGVVDLNTAKDTREGFHGSIIASGGSFNTADGYALAEYLSGKNTIEASFDGSTTSRYLNPPVTQNFSNQGTTNDYMVRYERDLGDKDRLSLIVRHGLSRFNVPNEQLQQAAGQRQDRSIFETLGIVSYQHIVSPNVLLNLNGMIRNDADNLWSNSLATPIIASQARTFSEGYVKGTTSLHQKWNNWKAGFEVDSTRISESFQDRITDPTQFDPATPAAFQFHGQKWDLEQAAFVQDEIRVKHWTFNAGVRWDRYQLLVNQNAVSPRVSAARYFEKPAIVVHASYDRVFQTPFFENILLSSSAEVSSLNPNFLRLPVKPSLGNYFEVGFVKSFLQKLTVSGNYFDRRMNNYLDDNQLLNTGVSFPISFAQGRVYGAEAKVDVPHWKHFSGYASYSYAVGSAYFPVSGGLFLGSDVAQALSGAGRFWDTQDQRNTVRTRVRYQASERIWLAAGTDSGSGLPTQFSGNQAEAISQYGTQIVDRVDLNKGRVLPSFALNASLGADLLRNDKRRTALQFDAENINNRLNVIDFAGLFSGNSIAPPRSYTVRLQFKF